MTRTVFVRDVVPPYIIIVTCNVIRWTDMVQLVGGVTAQNCVYVICVWLQYTGKVHKCLSTSLSDDRC